MQRLLGCIVVLAVIAAPASAEKRDLTPMPKVAAGSVPIGGVYRALIIGIDKHQDRQIPTLSTAAKDAASVRDLLVGRYGFKPEHVKTLFNEQATRVAVEGAMYALGQEARPDDSVLIYYAGHGQTDTEKVRGWWVPFDAKAGEPATFIKNASVRDEIAAMKAKHVYLVADSCFSGTLFAQSRSMPAFNDKFFDRLYQNKSRWGLTSGMNEPVADAGKGGHSIFAYFFLKVLRENEDPYVVPSHIYDQLAPLVGRNAEQQPRSEPLQGAGDEGGQFVFRLATGAAAKQPPAASAESAGSAELDAERQRLQVERDAFERQKMETERSRMEEERKRFAEEQQRAEEQRRAEAESKKMEVARAQYDNFFTIDGIRRLLAMAEAKDVRSLWDRFKSICSYHNDEGIGSPASTMCRVHVGKGNAPAKFDELRSLLISARPSNWRIEEDDKQRFVIRGPSRNPYRLGPSVSLTPDYDSGVFIGVSSPNE